MPGGDNQDAVTAPDGDPRVFDNESREMLQIGRRYRLDAFALILVPYLFLVGRFWTAVDDAFISFRYARNLALGHGLRYNLGEHLPVEGYSNFLWVMICAVFEFFRMDITFWASLLSTLCGVALLWLLFDVLRRRLEVGLTIAFLATLFVACFPPFAYWSTSGLATMPFALLVFVLFERLILRRAGAAGAAAGVVGLLLALMRTEGIAWLVVLAVLAIVSRRIAGQRDVRPVLVCLLVAGIGYVIYFAGRYAYYQLPWPNTVYVKMGADLDLLWRGGRYVLVYLLTFLTPALIVPGTLFALRRHRLAIGLPTAAMAWAFPLYAVVVTGDYMAMGRFLVPGVVFSAILFAWMLQEMSSETLQRRSIRTCAAIAAIVIGVLPGWNVHLVPRSVRARLHFRHNTKVYRSEFEQFQKEAQRVAEWATLGQALRYYAEDQAVGGESPSYVKAAIGAVGYYSDFLIFDRNGLVSPEVRRAEPSAGKLKSAGHDLTVAREFFLDRRPTIFYARLASDSSPTRLARKCARALRLLRASPPRYRLQEKYIPDLARVPGAGPDGNPLYLVVLRPSQPGTDWEAAQDDFSRRLDLLRSGQHLPSLLPDAGRSPPRPGRITRGEPE